MNGPIGTGLHAAAWLVVYTGAVAAIVLVALFARSAGDRPLRRLAAREVYAVVTISLAYVSNAFGIYSAMPASLSDLFSAAVNGVLLHALALIAMALYPVADAVAGSSSDAKGEPARRMERAGNAGALAMGVLFGAAYGTVGAVAAMLAGGLAAIAVAAFIASWYSRRMGGYSGDAMGAAVELGELLVLLLAAAVAR